MAFQAPTCWKVIKRLQSVSKIKRTCPCPPLVKLTSSVPSTMLLKFMKKSEGTRGKANRVQSTKFQSIVCQIMGTNYLPPLPRDFDHKGPDFLEGDLPCREIPIQSPLRFSGTPQIHGIWIRCYHIVMPKYTITPNHRRFDENDRFKAGKKEKPSTY